MVDKKDFKKLCKTSPNRTLTYLDILYHEYLGFEDEQKYIVEIMLECSSEEIERIYSLIKGGSLFYYEDYDNLMEREGFAACSFICGKEISEETFMALYDQGLIDDDRIYRCIAVNHTVYHKNKDAYTEPYVIWFS